MEKVIQIALLGAGTVGSGVVKVLEMNRRQITERVGALIQLKTVLVRTLGKARPELASYQVTDKIEDILNDEEIDVVVELMGGIHPAREYMLRAMEAGKSVVTANKDVVAQFGKDMFDMAERQDVDFLFEASVGGGIPIITPLKQCLTANKVTEIMGIVNGTTNYMLTKMTECGSDYNTVLKEAQEKGYAEKDPTADIEGHDPCRKIAILTSLVCGRQVDFEDIHCEGITKITADDFKYAKVLNRSIKLLASSRKVGNSYSCMVAPFMLSAEHPLCGVNGVFNGIFVHGNVLGDAMFYGSGAGKLPTASAVVADIVDMTKHKNTNIYIDWSPEKLTLVDYKDSVNSFFVRTSSGKETIENAFGSVEYADAGIAGEIGFTTKDMTEAEFEKAAAQIEVRNRIRLG